MPRIVATDLERPPPRTSSEVPAGRIRGVVVAVLIVSGAGVGCLGDGAPDRSREDRAPTTPLFRKLEERPLDLPRVHLHGRSIREYGVAGRCVEGRGVPVNALVLPHIPGVAALAPVGPPEQRSPVYAALPEGAPRIVFLASLPTLGNSRWRLARTLWISEPLYNGPVLVRGGRLDRTGTLRFGAGQSLRRNLQLPAGAWPGSEIGWREGGAARRAGWRVTEVPTLTPAPGCYAFQVDGVGFSYVLAFGAQ
jgi:hypothetical protein